MSWHDRSYANEPTAGYRRAGLGAVSVAGTLIGVNAFIAFLTLSGSRSGHWLEWLGVMQAEAVLHGQIWRLFTATYLHASLQHVFFNMLGLYFLGPPLEQVWGRRQFFLVYTTGGIVGNVLLTLAGAFGFINPLVVGLGASGSILTLLGAAAVLFPDARVYVYFLLPLRIRTVAILYSVWYVFNVLQRGANYGGDLCHIAGLIVGITWAYSGRLVFTGRHGTRSHLSSPAGRLPGPAGDRVWLESSPGPRAAAENAVFDRILGKMHDCGVYSLTEEEREFLRYVSEQRRFQSQ